MLLHVLPWLGLCLPQGPPAAVADLEPWSSSGRLPMRIYTEEDGLPTSMVRDVRSAPSGLPWFATLRGPVEFDGDRWRRLFPESLGPNTRLRFVRFDASGAAWLVERGGRIHLSSPDRTRIAVTSELPPWSMDTRAIDFAWVTGSAAVRALVLTDAFELWTWGDGGWARFPLPMEGPVLTLERAGARTFVGSPDGLFELRLGSSGGTLQPILGADTLPGTAVHGLSAEPTSAGGLELWLAGDGWVGAWRPETGFQRLGGLVPRLVLRANSAVTLVSDGSGGVLYGNSLRLLHTTAAGRTRTIGRSNGLNGGGVLALHRDEDDIIWGATGLGAFKILSLQAATYDTGQGLLMDEVSAILELEDGSLLFGHPGGLSVVRSTGVETITFQGVSTHEPGVGRVMDLHLGADGEVWIAGSGLGLGRWSGSGLPAWTPVPQEAGAWANTVHLDVDGTVLVGTSMGVMSFDGERFGGLEAKGFIRRIEIFGGTAYAASTAGLFRRGEAGWQGLGRVLEGQPADLFTVVGGASELWLGSGAGLFRVEGDAIVRAGRGLEVTRPVYSLQETPEGVLWVGTDRGFLRFEPAEGLVDGEPPAYRATSLQWMTRWTGLDANRAASIRTRSGAVWMGTNRCALTFDSNFEIRATAPVVELCEVELEGRARELDEPLRLGSLGTGLRFAVRAQNYLDEENVEFRSRLAGFTEWEYESRGTRHEARFAGLPAGEYRFEVQARHVGGAFGELVRSAPVTVVGPVWSRWWFFALIVAGTFALSFWIQSTVSARRQSQRLREEVAERTRRLEISLKELARTQRLHSLGLLAGGIAHDFRNLMTVVTGNLSLLREGSACAGDNESEELLVAAEKAVARAVQLSSQLQTFATGGAPIKRATSIAELPVECGSFVFAGSRVALKVDAEPDLWPVEADSVQLKQVFENLMLNARECQEDGGQVLVTTRNLELDDSEANLRGVPAGRYVEVKVEDDGPGVSAEAAAQIFDPFFTTKQEGRGLGLATADSIVRRHDGVLELERSHLGGACFRILLPASSTPVEEPERAQQPKRMLKGGRVLVLDDEEPIRVILERMLTNLGFEVEVTQSGDEALSAAARARRDSIPFDVAVVDLTLPGEAPGWEILAQLRTIQPDIAAIASNGYADAEVFARPESFGFQGVLIKPFDQDALRDALASLAEPGGPLFERLEPQRSAASDE